MQPYSQIKRFKALDAAGNSGIPHGRKVITQYSGLDVGFAVSPLIFSVFMDHGCYGATLVGAATVLI